MSLNSEGKDNSRFKYTVKFIRFDDINADAVLKFWYFQKFQKKI